MICFEKRITKALIRLRGCAGWSAPVLFANTQRQVFWRRGPDDLRLISCLIILGKKKIIRFSKGRFFILLFISSKTGGKFFLEPNTFHIYCNSSQKFDTPILSYVNGLYIGLLAK